MFKEDVKTIASCIIIAVFIVILASFLDNKDSRKYDKAIIDLGYKSITVEVEICEIVHKGKYKITTTNGEKYLVYKSDCILIEE